MADTLDDVSFVGTWERQDDELDFRSSMTGSDEADASAELAFSGIGVEVVVRRGRNGGLVDVELDGDVVLDDFDTYSRVTAFKQVIYTNKNLDAGSHTVRLVATGRKSAAATAADAMLDNFAVTMADTMRPRVLSVTSDASHPTKDSFAVTIDFLEDVTGLRAGEISVGNGSVSNFAGSGASYTLDIAPTAGLEGEVTVDVPANAVVDGANNGNLEGSETFTVDTRAPVIQTAVANQDVLTLVYGEALDPLSVPPASAFTLTGGGAPRTISNIVVNGSRVVLSMDPPASYGEAGLQVGYSAPSPGALADPLGNKVPSFTNRAVANESPGTTPSADTWIAAATAFSVREGDTAVATLTATEAATAAGDPVWWIPSGAAGGPDGGKFALSRAGVLAFAAAKDFEAPDDANADGSYQVTVRLSVGALTAAADLTVTLTDRNEAPVANARTDQPIVAQGATVTLSGSASDPDADDTLTYAWTQTGTPAVALSDAAAASPTFTAPSNLTEDTTLSFTLRVTDSSGLYHEDTVSVTVQTRPVLTAAFENAPARHDGSTPFAVDLRFSEEVALWYSAFTSGLLTTTGGTVQRASRLVPRSNIGWRIPVTPDGDGDVVITLPANRACSWLTGACTWDGRKLAVAASVTVPGPAPDITSAAAFTVQEGATAVGTLAATDADTAAADLVWTVPSGTAGGADAGKFTLGRAGVLTFTAAKDFEAPDDANTDGSYQVTVQVSDGRLTDTADLSVTLTDRNEAPTANAGADQDTVAQGATVTLSGSGTDPDAGDVLSYAWTKTAGSAVTLSDADKATASFAVPSGLTADATFTFKLKVTDRAGLYNEDTVSVTVAGPTTGSPQITSGSSFTVVEGGTAVATLTATDEDTDTADLTWTLSGGADQAQFSLTSAGVMSFASAKDFEAPDDANTDGAYGVSVQVSDGQRTDTADLTVTLTSRNEAPEADAGNDQLDIEQGATVTLSGSGSDPDADDELSYAWTKTAGPVVTLNNAETATATFSAPTGLTADATYTFTLKVTDTEGLYDEDSVTVRAGAATGPAATLEVLNVDFDDGDVTAWTVYDGSWSVTEGAYGVNGGGERKAVAAEVDLTDFVLEAEVRVKSTSGDAGVAFRVNDPGTGTDNYKGYYVGVASNSSLVFGKANAGRWQELDRVDLAFTLSRWYRLKVVASGTSIRVYVDEVLKIDATDASYDRGAIGLRTWRAEADWDNVTVSRIVEEDSVGFRVSAAATEIDEGGASTVTVATANGETFAAAQRIALSVSGSASTADYELASTDLTLAAGSAAVSVVLTAVDDEAEEAAETVTVTAARSGSEIGSATVTIRASDEPEVEDPAAPEIGATTSFTVAEGTTAVSTLTATDADTAAADLTWSILSGADAGKLTLTPRGVLAFLAAKDYEAPDDTGTDGTYQVTVQVSDGGRTDTADLTVTLANVNERPVADAGPDRIGVPQGEAVTLAGSGTDPDADDTLSYAWTKTAGPAVTLNNAETATATFTAPSGLTTDAAFTFKLKVTDAGGLFHEDSVAATVKGPDPAVRIAAGTSPVTEGTAATFTVSLDKDATELLSVTVTVTESESMLSGTPPTSVAFAVGDRTKTVTAATADDAVIETDSTVTAALGTGSDYTLGTASSAEVTVQDDDTATWQVSAAEASIDEGDATTLTVAVANGKTFAEEQSIALTVSGTTAGSDYSLTSSPLTLAAGSSSVTATLTAADDTDEESAETVTVAASHGGSSIGSVTVTIRANDVPLAQVTGVTVTELVESLSVTWSAVAGADSYRVQWREDGEAYEATRQHTVAGGLTSQTIERLAADTLYWSRVAATKAGADDGPWSAGASGRPRASGAGHVDGDLRLVGGEEDHEGRVEVYHDGEWGTVCDDYWGIADARVACRQLGFANANAAPRRARFGEGSGPIWMDNMDCTGAETALADCEFRGWGVHNCRHREDAGAVCTTGVDEGASAARAGLRDPGVGAPQFGRSAEGPAGTVPAHDDSLSIAEAVETAVGRNPASDLEVLDLTDRKLGDLAGVERLTGLRVLRLRGNAVADISPLAGLHGLRELDLSDNAVVDLWPLAGLSNLGNLDLSDNAVSDLSPLVGLERLSDLALDDNAVADLSPLAQLPGLARLRLSRNRIRDLSPLYGLTGLRELVLSGNAVVELWPLAQLSGLERLYLAGNVIEDPGPLAGLSSLQVLDLARNRIETVTGLARLDRVQTLKLDRNRLSVLYGLAGLESVEALSLRGNAIEDVDPLAPLANLRWLDLRDNPVSDLAPLAEWPVVVWLDGAAGRDRGQPPRRVILAPVEPVPDQPEL